VTVREAMEPLTKTDDALERALHRLRLNFYHLWRPIKELRESPDPSALLWEWYEAEEGTIERRNASFHKQAIQVLSAAMGTSRTKTKKLLHAYITQEESG
jgi:hypothetical protein